MMSFLRKWVSKWAASENRNPASRPSLPAGQMRVVSHRKISDFVYEVVTESAKYGRVTQTVLVLPDAVIDPSAHRDQSRL